MLRKENEGVSLIKLREQFGKTRVGTYTNIMKKLFIILLLFYGCKAKHTTTTVTKTDTIFKEKIVTITEPVFNDVIIKEPCDSLGNLKPINYTTSSGKVKVVLKSVRDTLYLTTNVDSIVDSRVNEFKSSYKTEKEVITKTKTPKWAWYSLIINVLLLLWIFRKVLFPTLNIFK